MTKKLILILFFAGLSHSLFAIGDDSTYHRFNPYWTKTYRIVNWRKLTVIDTTLNGFELYNPVNKIPGGRQLGNFGYPYYNFSPVLQKGTGLDVGIHAYDPYLFTVEDNLFYRSQKPYTYLSYLMGAKSEQYFAGTHTQNIGSRYNFGVSFRMLNSQGGFKHQVANYLNFNIFQSFTSRNGRYHIDVTTFHNRGKVQLNGGIAIPQDTVYHSSKYITKSIVPVRLDSARYGYKEYHAAFQHSYGWGSSYTQKINDSTTKNIFTPHYLLQHRFDYGFYRHTFNDDSSDFNNFPSVFENIYKSVDSIQYNCISNELRFKLLDEYKIDTTSMFHKVNGSVYLRQSFYTFKRGGYDDVENGAVGVELGSGIRKSDTTIKEDWNKFLSLLEWRITSEYSFMDYNKGDSWAELNLKVPVKKIYFEGEVGSKTYHASLIQQMYRGNYYKWSNLFDKQNSKWGCGAIGFLNNVFRLSYTHLQYTNPVYYGYLVKPEQFKGKVSGDMLSLNLNLGVGHFHLDNYLVYQKFDKDVFHLPEFYSTNSLYYAGFLFKKALQLRTGFNINYNTAYYADALDPSTSQFYLQNSVKTGDYLMADAFVDMKIRSVRIAIQMSNALQGLVGDGVQTSPGYLMPDRALKLYVHWMFWN